MPYCLNPRCDKPINPEKTNFCQNCGQRLRLGDRYSAYQPLGQGRSSRTFLGMDTHQILDPRCVLKEFPMGTDADALRQQTARLAELSEHPQIPNVLAYFERDRWQYLVQEFVDGRSLLRQLQEEGTFDEAQIREMLRTVLPVLQYLHDHFVIHRDVKPDNLVRRSDRSGTLMLVDFGAVKFSTQSTLGNTGTFLGSAEYAAPEQLMGKATTASDLYSLGASCLHLMTGLSPFDLFDSAQGEWRWRSVAVGISDSLACLLDRMMANSLSDRYATAAEILRDLGASPTQIQLAASWKKPVWSAIWQDAGTEKWECVQTIEVAQEVNALALVPDGIITAHNDGTPRRWDASTGVMVRIFEGHEHCVSCIAIAQDEATMVSGSQDQSLRVWDVNTGNVQHVLRGHRGKVTAIALDTSLLISASHDETIRLWELPSGQPLGVLQGHTHPIESLAYDPASQILVSGDAGGFVKLWYLGTRELLRTLSGHTARVSAVALIAATQTTLSSSWDMTLKLRDLNTGGLRRNLTGHLLPISALALELNHNLLATGSHDMLIKLWNPHDGKLQSVLSGHTGSVDALAFGAQGDCLWSGGRDRTLRCWKPAHLI
ncbi:MULTISPECIES: serine/threonine-protein kinase [unclassified Leptolyngbya]|uniref:serine/threonine-protein kinase n=1 Tax=unclassified Leptolyngbya TaxID=2650499 RepID=UPI001689FB60|nr:MULTISPECIES: serine/threonine-protein kinase [unclassified Leptolyngbya]MBD1912198.1 serine/threonine protein kinase [Leptolyngbya sp. FACHB-8]MBD2155089.1 serine/threonine protein kinase [Leptolyngbya sp. FACHB-16]